MTGPAFADLRRKKRLRQVDVAEGLGRSERQVARWEAGEPPLYAVFWLRSYQA